MTSDNNTKQAGRTGVWIMGVLGDIACTVIAGALAMKHGMTRCTGMVSELAPFQRLGLAPVKELVFSGMDVRGLSLRDAMAAVDGRSRSFPRGLLPRIADDLQRVEASIYRQPAWQWCVLDAASQGGLELEALVMEQCRVIEDFRVSHDLEHVVVVCLSSAEALPRHDACHDSLDLFEQCLRDNRKDLIPPSMACAYAAFRARCAFINFTPNPAAASAALSDLALRRGLPHYGNDGKTGETLIKSALAPMFAMRNFQVMSWEGCNLLGNGDGHTLSRPEKRRAKIANKSSVLRNILGYAPHEGVSINYVPSLGDWKTAWDLIHFKGFMDVAMSMQFTWQGCDSILAAPLVLDLARFSALALARRESGPMCHLSCFFKRPLEVSEMSLQGQYDALRDYAESCLVEEGSMPA